jgi:hypothetical protein
MTKEMGTKKQVPNPPNAGAAGATPLKIIKSLPNLKPKEGKKSIKKMNIILILK